MKIGELTVHAHELDDHGPNGIRSDDELNAVRSILSSRIDALGRFRSYAQ